MFGAREVASVAVAPAPTPPPQRSANDYDSPEDALAGAAARIGAEWYIREGDNVTVFMRSRDGYLAARLFRKGGWYHWPTDWPEEIRNLPIGARRVPHAEAAELPRWTEATAEEHSPPDASFIAAQRRLLEALRGRGWRVRSNEAELPGEVERVRILPQLRNAVEIWKLVPSFAGYSSSYEWSSIHFDGDIRKTDVGELLAAVEKAYAEDYKFRVSTMKETSVGASHEAAEQSEPSGEANAIPWVKLERNAEAYAAQIEDAKAVGKVSGPRPVYDMLHAWCARQDQEVFLVVAIDIRGQCRGVVEVHRGARSRVSVDVPEILRVANALGGEMFCVVHNHPTTHATPSPADKSLTKAIEKAAKASEQVMMDHVIIGMGEYFSFAENKLTKVSKRERSTKRARGESLAADDAPGTESTIVVAPSRTTPAWLTVGADGRTLLVGLWGMRVPGIEVDIPEENEGWSESKLGWEQFRSDLLSSAPNVISPQILYADVKRGPKAKGLTPLDKALADGLKAIGVRHNGSPVWWTDLDQGPVAAASLYDVARFDQPYVIPRSELAADLIGITLDETDKEVIKAQRKKIMRFHKRPLYLLSLDQWDNAEWPAESQGGPPFTEHVSVGREAEARA